MKVIGITAEYNPFHNGHLYQIQKIREQTQADYVVIAMSGDFVQRGAPAILDKYTRAQMALLCGADLVFEIPSLWSCASAEFYALASMTIFAKSGIVDGISFGCEQNDLSLFTSIADLLSEEPPEFCTHLQSHLKNGLSFPAAREKAILEYFPDTSHMQIAKFLSAPNNLLGIEYIKALRQLHADLLLHPIQRVGSSYHATDLNSPTASATAVRELLLAPSQAQTGSFGLLSAQIPAPACKLLLSRLQGSSVLCEKDFSLLLHYALLSTKDLTPVFDCPGPLANRIRNLLPQYEDITQFCQLLKTRDLTYTRISRALFHLLLGHQKSTADYWKGHGMLPYLRVLGFRKNSSVLLKQLHANTELPVILRPADMRKDLSAPAQAMLDLDCFAHQLYQSVLTAKIGQPGVSEDHRPMLVV